MILNCCCFMFSLILQKLAVVVSICSSTVMVLLSVFKSCQRPGISCGVPFLGAGVSSMELHALGFSFVRCFYNVQVLYGILLLGCDVSVWVSCDVM